ncbi:MAG: acyl-CoA dehydrogenase family protein [Parvibaculum sp.]|uniref:acyl-CoA dehydrogenase family protein n=1 Tax=Parvibaculum sp. TaxID=2024848 RepID=UPI002844B273|nr:acyl-CoA dehydrogenase family protein [Parvibaculum sp.]MDR3498027.1 acyl-CoA dehydrogenase family protein [Parvibaculum sp.]
MSPAPTPTASHSESLVLSDLLPLAGKAIEAADALLARAKAAVAQKTSKDGRVAAALVEREQFAAHGLAWVATYVEALRQLHVYATRMTGEGRFGEIEALMVQVAFGEYLQQLSGGIPMSQGEIVRPQDLGLTEADETAFLTKDVLRLIRAGNTAPVRDRLAALIAGLQGAATFGDAGLEETYETIRDQMRRFADAEVVPHAHDWHLKDDYIPMSVIAQMAELGVFGLTIPEEFGGLGLGKESMCVVSEELSRGYIGVGSLGTRSEIAAELILGGGTPEQKAKWLPKIASGEVLPTAVFTEPNTGSDLASLKTRGRREGDVYKITGNKTWITHAARADVMTLLCRTNDQPGYKGLSMMLAEKPRGDEKNPFPAKGMTGGEIHVLGYRGMKEFELGFDNFEVKAENLLGGEEGQGFKQLMQTFESARIQTAARAIGVAQAALELGLSYAQERIQFAQPIFNFPRVSGKLVMMAVEILIARQLTYHAAREKDGGRRCDLEAGMAKLLAARVAWAAADNALQIHGGNGFALEYKISRVLCDARILNIFEGAAEIQAQVIARRLLEGGN